MLGALGKAFGSTGKAIGKGVKSGAKGMGMGIKNRMMQNRPPDAGMGGGIGTDPSPSFMSRFGQATPEIMQSLSTMGQPQTSQPQQRGGMMGNMGPLIQSLLQKAYAQPSAQMPTNSGTGQNMGYAAQDGMVNNPNMGVLGPQPGGMDIGPSYNPMTRNRMPGMY